MVRVEEGMVVGGLGWVFAIEVEGGEGGLVGVRGEAAASELRWRRDV